MDMDSASPTIAGIGQKTSRDAASVAFKASAGFFTWDFADKPTSNMRTNWQNGASRIPHRASGHPRATGDGLA